MLRLLLGGVLSESESCLKPTKISPISQMLPLLVCVSIDTVVEKRLKRSTDVTVDDSFVTGTLSDSNKR